MVGTTTMEHSITKVNIRARRSLVGSGRKESARKEPNVPFCTTDQCVSDNFYSLFFSVDFHHFHRGEMAFPLFIYISGVSRGNYTQILRPQLIYSSVLQGASTMACRGWYGVVAGCICTFRRRGFLLVVIPEEASAEFRSVLLHE
jgi:hypothetical protein